MPKRLPGKAGSGFRSLWRKQVNCPQPEHHFLMKPTEYPSIPGAGLGPDPADIDFLSGSSYHAFMITRLLGINAECLDTHKFGRIIRVLNQDGVIVYPTDTFYGLGGSCFSAPAIERIYELKRRDPAKPLLVVVSDTDMAIRLASDIPPLFTELASKFWPGPLTLILRAAADVPRELLGDGDSIAVRLPGVFWLRALIRQADFPIVATSANISGEKEVSTAEEALALFNGTVDLVVDGGRTEGFKPSTVVDLTGAKPRLVREGALPKDKLGKYFQD